MKITSLLPRRVIAVLLALTAGLGSAYGQQSFQITSLSTTGSNIIEHNFVTGDDRGGIALSTSNLFYTGDGATGRFDVSNLSNNASTGFQYDALASNIRTKQVYSLGTSSDIVANGGG